MSNVYGHQNVEVNLLSQRSNLKPEDIISIFENLSSIDVVDKNLLNSAISYSKEWLEIKQRPAREKAKVVCTGIYNAGKSSLLNALIGENVFDIGDVPTTKAINAYENDMAVFVDTPGLNANEMDDSIAKSAYKDANIVIFVSNIQNGGLNTAEARHLSHLIEIMGGKDIASGNIIFVLSNLHQVSSLSIDKIKSTYEIHIERTLGIKPNIIFEYDVTTYFTGVKNNNDQLIKESKLPELKIYIDHRIKLYLNDIVAFTQAQIDAKKKKMDDAITIMLNPIEARLKSLAESDEAAQSKINRLIKLKQSHQEKIATFIKNELLPPKSFVAGSMSFDYPSFSFSTEYKSERDALSAAREKLSRPYNKREAVLRDKVKNIEELLMGYMEYNMVNSNFYYRKNLTATSILLEYAKALNAQSGVTVPSRILDEIKVVPKFNSNSISNLRSELSEDVVRYGEYYSLDWYVRQNVEIYDYQAKESRLFDSGIRYSIRSLHRAVDEMRKDMNDSLQSNINSVWKYSIISTITIYLDELNKELSTRITGIDNEVDKFIRENKSSIDAQKDYLDILNKLNR